MATFKKTERLHKKKEVAFLFDQGKGLHAENIKLVYAFFPNATEYEKVKGLFVAPKRLFKRSPDRNLLKRRMREVFRLSKEAFKEGITIKENESLLVGFIYKSNVLKDYTSIQMDMHFLFKKLSERLKQA
jgi:ribonuclease P protein component